jgi:hypothetical protein
MSTEQPTRSRPGPVGPRRPLDALCVGAARPHRARAKVGTSAAAGTGQLPPFAMFGRQGRQKGGIGLVNHHAVDAPYPHDTVMVGRGNGQAQDGRPEARCCARSSSACASRRPTGTAATAAARGSRSRLRTARSRRLPATRLSARAGRGGSMATMVAQPSASRAAARGWATPGPASSRPAVPGGVAMAAMPIASAGRSARLTRGRLSGKRLAPGRGDVLASRLPS